MKEKSLKFIKENGFLLFLFVCVCIVAATTIFVITRDPDLGNQDISKVVDKNPKDGKKNEVEGESKEVSSKPDDLLEEKKGESKENQEAPNKDKEEPAKDKEDPTKDKEEAEERKEPPKETKEQPQVNKIPFMLPIAGDIITEFTKDSLVYSKTLDEWRAHTGIDIKADSGTKVKAASAGTVKEVYEDPLWGNVIILDHGNGLLSKYANLGTKDMVKVGLKVNMGDEIATVGKSANIEMLMESHLHFEVIKDGKNVDPRSIK